MNKREINALINLLDDPEEDIFNRVKDKLLEGGETIIPALESAWEKTFNEVVQSRLEDIIHKIEFNKIIDSLKKWRSSGYSNLLEGALTIAGYQYPDLNRKHLLEQLKIIKQDVWIELNSRLTGLEKIKIMNHVFFDVHRFTGNTENYSSPDNSYLNKVIENKKGNPLSLAILYIHIAHELRLPVYGINLPQHFIMGYLDINFQEVIRGNEKILFYINPFSKGTVFSRKEIDVFLDQLYIKHDDSYYSPCSNVDILKRLTNNLIASYSRLGKKEAMKDCELIHKVLSL